MSVKHSETMKLYYDGFSQPCRAVYLFLKTNNIDFELHKLVLFKGETKTPEYLTTNPYGAIPCLIDGDFVLTESVAIMIYLCDKYADIPDHWYPKEPKRRAKIHQFLGWYPSTLRKLGTDIFLEKALQPFLNNKPFDEGAYEQHVEKIEPELKKFEDLYLKENGFIFGDEISIADLLAVSELFQPIAGQYDMDKHHPKIAQYMERVKAKTEPHFSESIQRMKFVKDQISKGKSGLELLPTDPNVL